MVRVPCAPGLPRYYTSVYGPRFASPSYLHYLQSTTYLQAASACVETPHNSSSNTTNNNSQASATAAAEGKHYETPRPALNCTISSSFHGSRVPEELPSSSSATSARRDVLLVTVAGLAHIDGFSAVQVVGTLPEDFSTWRGDENVDKTTQSYPILYDRLDPPTSVIAPGRRIVAIGDVHGDLARTECALQLAGVLGADGRGRWVGDTTVLVQVGDILDRGEDEIAILSLLHNLRQQARRSGGAVFQINGNHETMNVERDFRFVNRGGLAEAENFTEYCEEVHDGDYDAAFSGWYLASKRMKESSFAPFLVSWILNPLQVRRGAAARGFLFGPGGPIARKLSQHGVVLQVNGWLFAHGGVLPHHVDYGLERLNDEVSKWMRGDNLEGNQRSQIPFLAMKGSDSIVWSRLYSKDENLTSREKFMACAMLDSTLEAVGAQGLVVGHTPQVSGANCQCNGKVWRIDVGMSSGVLNAQPEVLEINGNQAHVLTGRSLEEESTPFMFTDAQL